ncbi:MAG: aspartate racemase [Acidobacteriota bacterium]|jgi:aspartate racemase|nr:aspartate racemase [Acidobacteriota bacterium]
MKMVGIIGGIGPESTVEYYRLIIESYREQKRDESYPSIIINSIDLTKLVDLITAKSSSSPSPMRNFTAARNLLRLLL